MAKAPSFNFGALAKPKKLKKATGKKKGRKAGGRKSSSNWAAYVGGR
jgi:hypothetical protein